MASFQITWRCNNNAGDHQFDYNTTYNDYVCIHCQYQVKTDNIRNLPPADYHKFSKSLMPGTGMPFGSSGGMVPAHLLGAKTHHALDFNWIYKAVDKYRATYGQEPEQITVSSVFQKDYDLLFPPIKGFHQHNFNSIPIEMVSGTTPEILASNTIYTNMVSVDLSIAAQPMGLGAAIGFNPPPYQGRPEGIEYQELAKWKIANATQCVHTWQSYAGLTEVYDFCTKCDEKAKK